MAIFKEQEEIEKQRGISDFIFTPIYTIAHILDTPASAIRGMLAGKDLDEIVEGIWDVDKRTSGRDVLRNFGWAEESGKLAGFDVASLATEIVADPLLALGSVTGMTKAGKAATLGAKELGLAKKAGQMLKNEALLGKIGDPEKILATLPEAFHSLGPATVKETAKRVPEVWKAYSSSLKTSRKIEKELALRTVPSGMTRLFRGETSLVKETPEKAKEIADWLKQNPQMKGYEEAKGRWFAANLEDPNFYAQRLNNAPEQGRIISYVDVPTSELEKFRASNTPKLEFYGGAYAKHEFFLPKELAAQRKSITDLISEKTIPEQIAAGQRGISLSAPFGKSEYVPRELNKFLSKPIELANKGWGKVVSGASTVFKPLRNAFITKKVTEVGEFGRDMRDFAEGAANWQLKKRSQEIDKEFDLIVEHTGKTPQEVNDMLVRGVEFAGTPEKIRLWYKNAVDVLNEDVGLKIPRMINKFETRKKAVLQPLSELKAANTLDPDAFPAFIADFKSKYGLDLSQESIPEVISRYETSLKRLDKDFEKSKKYFQSNLKTRLAKLQQKKDERLGKAIAAQDMIGPDGSMPAKFVDEIKKGFQKDLDLEKQNMVIIEALNDPFIGYFPHQMSPEGRAIYERVPEIRKFVDREFHTELAAAKERKWKNMDVFELNSIFREKFKLDTDFWDTDVKRVIIERERKSAKALSQSRTLNAAIQFTAEEAPGPGSVHIAEVLQRANMHGFLPKGSTEPVTWSLKSTNEEIIRLLKRKKIKDVWLPKDVAQDLMVNQSMFDLGSLENIFRIFDPINTVYRSMLTAVPAHTGTNIVGNSWMQSIRGLFPFTPKGAKKNLTSLRTLLGDYFERNPESPAKGIFRFKEIFKEVMEDAEKVRDPAIRLPDGRIIPGKQHALALFEAEKILGVDLLAKENIPLFEQLQSTRGWTTNKGRFISRDEGLNFPINLPKIKGKVSQGLIPKEERKLLEAYEIFGGGNRNIISEIELLIREGEKGKVTKFFMGELTGLETPWPARKGSQFFAFTKQVNNLVEEAQKFALFRHEVEKGASVVEAGRTVKKYLFDYTDLTGFEKKVMRRAVLFYTFARKNLPLAIQETLLNRNAYMLAKAPISAARDEDFVPDYILDQGNLRLGPGHYIDLKQPLFEANRFAPQGGGVQRIFDKIFQQLAPQYKLPLEFVSGREFFRGVPLDVVNKIPQAHTLGIPPDMFPGIKKIETKTGGTEYRGPGWLAETLRNVPWSRQTQIAQDIAEKEIHPITSLFGLRERQIDPEKLKLQATIKNIKSILSKDPAVREFNRYFSIEKEPNAKVKALNEQLRKANEKLTGM